MRAELIKRVKIARLALWIAVSLLSPAANAAVPTPLRIAYPAPTSSFLPLWAANDAGFFKKHELSAEIIQVGSSTRGMAALIAGQVDILAGGGTGGVGRSKAGRGSALPSGRFSSAGGAAARVC